MKGAISVMDDPGSIIFNLLLLFVLVLVNAFFAMSEIAIISLNDNMIDKLADEGDKKAKQIRKLTENPSNFLSTIQIGVPWQASSPQRVPPPPSPICSRTRFWLWLPLCLQVW